MTELGEPTSLKIKPGDIIGKYFVIRFRIAIGHNASIFAAKSIFAGNAEFAIKATASALHIIDNEAAIYDKLGDEEQGIANLILHGRSSMSPLSFLVMDKLGVSVAKYWEVCGFRFNYITVCRIAIQVLQRLKFVHGEGVLHRDIKPNSLVMGGTKNTEKIVFLIDFGESTCYEDEYGHHVSDRACPVVPLTPLYGSPNAHQCRQLSRRDDLYSLGYTLLHLATGSLPWESPPGEGDERVRKIARIKREMTVADLCQDLPQMFRFYFQYVESLAFDEKPDYSALVLLFKDYLHGLWNVTAKDKTFEWTNHPHYVPPMRD